MIHLMPFLDAPGVTRIPPGASFQGASKAQLRYQGGEDRGPRSTWFQSTGMFV